jgi:hypothetical protein
MPGKPGPRAWPPEPWTVPGVSWPGRPGPWTVGRAWCALVRDLVAELRRLVRLVRVPGGVRLVRDPWRVRPGGPRPWRVRLVAWPTAPGPRPPVGGPRPPAPGPKNGPGRVLRGHLPDFAQSVVPETVFRIPVSRETSSWKKGPL